jgi:hypothetical protein
MRRTADTQETSFAWVKALRAAALILNREVCRYVLACRADLDPGHRGYLQRVSQRAWHEASDLYSADVWEHFEIDEVELKRRALKVARLRQAGRLEEAAEEEREALRRALSSVRETVA